MYIGTSEIGIYSFMYNASRRVFLVDTPGFDDTNRSDTDVLKDIAYYLSETYKNGLELTGIIYLHRITDVRMAGSALNNLRMFKALCGEGKDVFKHIVLATTMWGNLNGPGLSRAEGEKRQKELLEKKEWWGMMHRRGSQVYEYGNDKASAMIIISCLVRLQTTTVLDIQKEMIEDHRSLENTSAGQEVEKELQELKHKHEEDLANLEAEKEEALAEKDQELLDELSKQFDETNRKLEAAAKAQADLKIDFERLEMEQQAKYRHMLEEQTTLQAEKTRELERRTETRIADEKLASEQKERRMEQRIADEKLASEQKERRMDERQRSTEQWYAEQMRRSEDRVAEKARLQDEEHRKEMKQLEERMAEERGSFNENRMVLRARSVSVTSFDTLRDRSVSAKTSPSISPYISSDDDPIDRSDGSKNRAFGNMGRSGAVTSTNQNQERGANADPGAAIGLVAMLAGVATFNPVLMAMGAGATATAFLSQNR